MTSEEPDPESLTYADSGVDIEASDAAAEALTAAFGEFDTDAYAGLLDIGDRYLGVATDGVGTKLLVAEAVAEYGTVGIDCIAMNANDLVAMGVEPLGFVDYLAVDEPDDAVSAAIGAGLAEGAERGDIALLGGETAVLPEIVSGFDLAGTCVGIAEKEDLFDGQAAEGDRLVGYQSSGIHSNGLTLARTAVTRRHAYSDPFPADPDRRIADVLLEPTRLYTHLLDPLCRHGVRAAAHVTGGGWTNLHRLGEHRYVIEEPWPAHDVFSFVQDEGGVTDEEMHRTFNMGTGFVVAAPPNAAHAVADETNGRVIGRVEAGDTVEIRGLEL